MRKIQFAVLILACLFASCTQEEEGPTQTPVSVPVACYQFTIRTVRTVSPDIPGYPYTEYSIMQKCELTAEDAERIKAENTTTYSSSIGGGYVITIVTTCTYYKLV